MNVPAELAPIARRVVWFEPVDYTLEHPDLFLAHVMVYGRMEDVIATKRYFDEAAFRLAIQHAPAGLFDPRSWGYWRVVLGLDPTTPLPSRRAA
ncbi:MAG: hypothetical protein A2992_00245 [Elusimicrobia bacterium RIFCSPLOWO2_01_FULL_59_12]|nr:MAG: hypothetical protein A2992_00245 [Elusimicrobia bacterium RIFCSPLOWO2_01_FULL_59_12]